MTEPGTSVDGAGLSAKLAEMAEAVAGCASTKAAGDQIVRAAADVVDGTAMAGWTVFTHTGLMRTRAYTNTQVLLLDHLQMRYREGPCLAAASSRGREIIRVEDMAREQRWPRYAPAAVRLGVRSTIVCGLPLPGGGTVALNLHAYEPEAFDATAVERAALFAAYSSVAYSQARLAENVVTALTSRQVTGEAAGILMERHQLGSAEALERLSCAAQRLNAQLWRVAEHVVRTGADPAEITADDLPDK